MLIDSFVYVVFESDTETRVGMGGGGLDHPYVPGYSTALSTFLKTNVQSDVFKHQNLFFVSFFRLTGQEKAEGDEILPPVFSGPEIPVQLPKRPFGLMRSHHKCISYSRH